MGTKQGSILGWTPRRSGRGSRRRRSPVALVVVLVLALGGAGIGAFLATRSSQRSGVALPGGDFVFTPGPSPLPLSKEPGFVAGAPAPDFSVRSVDGRTVTLSDVRGSPTVLFFMAYWCGSCIPEAEALGRIHQEFADRGVRIIAVDLDPTSSPALVREFAGVAGNPEYTFALDDGGATARAYKVRSLDTTIIIDRAGRITYRDEYPTDYETLRRAVSEVV